MSDSIRQLLLQVIRERNWSLSSVSRKLSPSSDRSRLSKILRGLRPLTVEDLQRALRIIGEPEAVFWRRHLTLLNAPDDSSGSMEAEPSVILRAIAGPNPAPLPPVLQRLIEANLPPLDREVEFPIPPRVYSLDQFRQQNAAGALERAEEWIASCSKRLFSRRHDNKLMAELVTAIGLWSSAAQTSGRSRKAALALSFAFKLCGPMRGTPQFAYLLWRSSLVLVDCGFPTIALEFLERAYTLFVLWDLENEQNSILHSMGSQAAYCGRWTVAKRCFERCLSTAATDDQKASAIFNLASLYERLEAPEKALETLDSFWNLIDSSLPRIRTLARWVKARALAQGNLEQQHQAAELFSAVGSNIARHCEPFDPFLFFCDHATLLLRLNDQAGLRIAAGAIAGLLPRLESTPLYEAVAQKVADILTGIKASTEELRGLRLQLETESG